MTLSTGYTATVTSLTTQAGNTVAAITGNPLFGLGDWYSPAPTVPFINREAIAAYFTGALAQPEAAYVLFYETPCLAPAIESPLPESRVGTMMSAKYEIDFIMSIQKAYTLRRRTRLSAAADAASVSAAQQVRTFPKIYINRLLQLEADTLSESTPSSKAT